MKKIDTLILLLITIAMISTSCSSTKGSSKKGGGWYKNRNVIHFEMNEKEVFAYQKTEFSIEKNHAK